LSHTRVVITLESIRPLSDHPRRCQVHGYRHTKIDTSHIVQMSDIHAQHAWKTSCTPLHITAAGRTACLVGIATYPSFQKQPLTAKESYAKHSRETSQSVDTVLYAKPPMRAKQGMPDNLCGCCPQQPLTAATGRCNPQCYATVPSCCAQLKSTHLCHSQKTQRAPSDPSLQCCTAAPTACSTPDV
jgi:hypothetical protein